ncbi:hypothetical protein ACQVP2_07290 [Methylobacterium aquaticum]|uniref:hypothetical protein n=1 Tax=Methylobacterium aquaticum TaxID=270351 RepID=UPI003D17566A
MSGPSEHVSIADREIAARKRRDEALAILASLPATAVAEAPICLGDPDVTLFFAVAYGRMHPADALALCRKRFGDDRTPCRSAVSRLWRRLGAVAAYQDRFGDDEALAAAADRRAEGQAEALRHRMAASQSNASAADGAAADCDGLSFEDVEARIADHSLPRPTVRQLSAYMRERRRRQEAELAGGIPVTWPIRKVTHPAHSSAETSSDIPAGLAPTSDASRSP